ncbi:MAG TPA: sigma-70 family RNA polymerase sigma factor [Kofleriaceae bacterium]|nr:sigma-70 family RNA polymerase sigma factor [Kofleriaceae bacterium]
MAVDPTAWAEAREQFLALVGELRPELHRYCARLTGSIIQGEDIVQDTLAKAFYAIAMQPELPPLRPWLFRIAHNAAIDHLRSHGHKYTEPRGELADEIGSDDRPDPDVVRAALSRFLVLTLAERSAMILKDVLGHSVEEAAATMDTTVAAVKAALVRGRAKLRDADEREAVLDASSRAQLDAYARLFNARDWDGVRALVGEDCRLDLVSKSQRRGKAVGMYFSRYEKEDVRLEVAALDGRLVLAAYVAGATAPSYFIVLELGGDHIRSIRDFRYVPYIAAEAELG